MIVLCVLMGLVLGLRGQNIEADGEPLKYSVGISGAMELEFLTEMGVYYQVEISPDLSNWDIEGYSIKGTGGLVSTVVSTRQYKTAFYRVSNTGTEANVAPWPEYTAATPIEINENTIGLNTTSASAGDYIRYDGTHWVYSGADPISTQVLNNMQPYQVVNYCIALVGTFPSRSSADPLIGEIMLFAGNFAPRNWALCDGQLLSISQYSALFSILGTTYGGDGRTTFGLPDLRGRVAIHEGHGPGLSDRRLGEKGGTETTTHSH